MIARRRVQRLQDCNALPRRQAGWGASEYLSVMVGLMVVWRGAEAVLTLIKEHHDKFVWALMIPF